MLPIASIDSVDDFCLSMKKNTMILNFAIRSLAKLRFFGRTLIIYLSAILQKKNNGIITPTIVAQLSYHEDSMSIGYGNSPVVIGYWVSKIWAFEELCKKEGMLQEASLCGAYLFLSGLKNAIQNLAGNQSKWVFSILKETFQILISAAKNKIFFHSFVPVSLLLAPI